MKKINLCYRMVALQLREKRVLSDVAINSSLGAGVARAMVTRRSVGQVSGWCDVFSVG